MSNQKLRVAGGTAKGVPLSEPRGARLRPTSGKVREAIFNILGESIIGVVIAAIVVFSGKASPLALVGAGFGTAAIWIGGIAFVAVNVVLYRWVARLGRAPAAA